MKKIAKIFFLFIIFTVMLSFTSKRTSLESIKNTLGSFNCSYTRIAPMVIASDADYDLYDNGVGDGSPGNPWIIENFLIECNGTGSGILISNADDFAIFRNGFVNESAAGVNGGIIAQSSWNIVIDNCTFDQNTVIGIGLVDCDNIDIINTNSTNAACLLLIDGCFDINVDNCHMSDGTGGFANILVLGLISANSSRLITFQNSIFDSAIGNNFQITSASEITFVNATVIGDSYALYLTNVNNLNITDSTFEYCSTNAISFDNVDNSDFVNCDFENNVQFGINVIGVASNDNFTLTDSRFTNSSGIDLGVDENVLIRNCTLDAGVEGFKVSGVIKALIEDCLVTNINQRGISIDGTNVSIIHNTIINVSTDIALGMTAIDSIVANNTVLFTNVPLGMGGSNIIIDSNYISGAVYDAITINPGAENITVINNVVYSPAMPGFGTCDAGVWFDAGTTGYAVVRNNTFDTLNDTANGRGVLCFGTDNILITGNRFIKNNYAISILASPGTNVTVTGNYFEYTAHGTPYVESFTGAGVFDSNYYIDYFDIFPYAITDLTLNILEYEFPVGAGINDTHPLYYASWFTRNTQVFFNLYSNIDGLGIPVSNLHLLLNNISLTITNPIIPEVLFRLTVNDYRGRLLYDAILNLNSTGIYIDIGLDVVLQIFFHFYSSIDYFGLDFTTIKLFIDNVRITRFDPIMELEIVNVTVKDYANMTIYSQSLNLSVVGVYLDIGLPIAPIVIQNLHERAVIFNITRNGVSTGLVIGKGMSVIMRFALGTYKYRVTEMNGHRLAERNAVFAGMDIIEIGPYGSIPNVPEHDPIQILSEADLLAFPDKSGTGTNIDPYVIDYWFIQANLTSPYAYCIDIENTISYVEFRGLLVQGSRDVGGRSSNIIVRNATNIKFINCTSQDVEDSRQNILIIDSLSILIDNCTVDCFGWTNATRSIDVEDSIGVTINNTVISNCYVGAYFNNVTYARTSYCTFTTIDLFSVSEINLSNSTVIGNIAEGYIGIYITGGQNHTISSNTITVRINQIGISVPSVRDAIISGNIVNGFYHGIGINVIGFCDNITILNNTANYLDVGISISVECQTLEVYDNIVQHNYIGVLFDGYNYDISFTGNLIARNNYGIEDSAHQDNLNITFNYFDRNTINYYNVTDFSPSAPIIDRNYYYDYFSIYPYDVFLNYSTIELQHDYILNAGSGIVDYHPLFYVPWYAVQRDFYIHLNSTIDFFGLSFDLVNVYIDGQQLGSNVISFDKFVFRLTVKDFALVILYDVLYNYNTSKHAIIGLAIAPCTFYNNYSFPIIVYLNRQGVTLSFTIQAKQLLAYPIRLAIGKYTYSVTDLDGNDIEDSEQTVVAADPSTFAFIFGKVTVIAPLLPPNLIALAVAVILVIGILGGTLGIATLFRRRSGKGKRPKYIM